MADGDRTAARPRRRSPEALAERRAARAAIEEVGPVVEYAAWLLESRARSVADLRRRLVTAGYRPTLVEDALGRLTELGFLDDEAYARAWVESRDRARPRGEHALRRELALRGVERPLIDTVLDERRGAGDAPAGDAGDADDAAAERLLTKRLPSILREPDPRRRLQKAYALLARNGFSPDVCSSVARRVLAESDTDAEE